MFNIDRWQEIFEAIGKNKLRTFLTGVSVSSGIFILVILLGVGKGLENGVSSQFEKDASNRIETSTWVTNKEYKGLNPGRKIQLRNEDYEMVQQVLGNAIEKKTAQHSNWSANFLYGKETASYRVQGCHADMAYLENISLTEGRFINEKDVLNYGKVTVIGNKVKEELFDDNEKALGKYIQINTVVYLVIGVYTDPGGEREESNAFIPITTAQKVFSAGDQISRMAFTLPKRESYEQALKESQYFQSSLLQLLKGKHIVAPDDNAAIRVFNLIEEAKKYYDLNKMIRLFFWGVGICTILAGVVGVSNIMMIVVKERTKEIGVRKALGATPKVIIGMILHESIFITAVSGLVGLISSLFLLELMGPKIVSDFFTNPSVDFNVAFTTVGILVLAGALAGFVPAYKAANIKPIEALRDE